MADYFTVTNVPATSAALSSAVIRAEIALIAAGFVKVAGYTSAANRVVHINAGATAQTTTSGFTFDGTTFTAPALAVTNAATVTGDLAVNGGDLTSTAATFNLLNATTTTLNIGGAATTIGIGATTGTLTVANTTLAAKAITASTTLGVTGTATMAAITASGLITANAGISVPTGQNVTGAGTAQVTGFATISGTTLTGTLSTAAQPNVTSLGTLSGLTVTAAPTFSALTATRVPFAGTAGLLSDSASLTYASGTGTLTATTFSGALSGTASTATALATARAIYGNNFDGTAALAQIIASTYGGTGNGFTKFSGPTTAEKTFTLPDASSTLLYSGGALGTPTSGVATNLTGLPLTTGVTGILPTANGGTGIAYFTAAGPTVARVYTFPDAAATILYSGGDAGTPSALVGTNISGTAASLTAGVASAVAASGITGTTLAAGVVTSSLTTVGALNSGSITNGFGSIDVGADAISGGAGSFTTGTFTGDVYGTTDKNMSIKNATNTGVHHVGGSTTTVLTDGQSITVDIYGGEIISVNDLSDGKSASFFANHASATIVEIADPSAIWSVTDTDTNPGWAIFKSAASYTVTIKNYMNGTRTIIVNVLGHVTSATAPAP